MLSRLILTYRRQITKHDVFFTKCSSQKKQCFEENCGQIVNNENICCSSVYQLSITKCAIITWNLRQFRKKTDH